jgi:hypothetical protein
LKQRKENDIPMAMLQNQEPAKKRSKLVLPEPQISDQVGRRLKYSDNGVQHSELLGFTNLPIIWD